MASDPEKVNSKADSPDFISCKNAGQAVVEYLDFHLLQKSTSVSVLFFKRRNLFLKGFPPDGNPGC